MQDVQSPSMQRHLRQEASYLSAYVKHSGMQDLADQLTHELEMRCAEEHKTDAPAERWGPW